MYENYWYRNAIFYELYVRAFKDSNGDGHGDLNGLISGLDYLKDLGVDCIWVMPIYPSPLKDDGYDISDYYNIHPSYGDIEDFTRLVEEAHKRGLRVIADMVLNHISDQHPWFQSAIQSKDSPYRDYFVWSDTDKQYADARIIFIDSETSNWTYEPHTGQYYWHRFYASQPDLNYDNPAVQDEMIHVIRFWLEKGIDGFRVDAVPYLFEREGTNCENLPETHAFLKRIRRVIDEEFPGRILLCEANQWPKDVEHYFGDGDECQMAFQFPLMPRIFLGLMDGISQPIRWAQEQTGHIPANCQWCTFLRNHDELTLEMVTPTERTRMWAGYAPLKRMRSNLGIRRRLAPLLDNDRRKIELANSILFSLPGTPIIYYGDEIGMGDNIYLHDRNGVRTPLQWTDGLQAGFSASSHTYSPLVKSEGYEPAKVNVAAQRQNPNSLWHTLRRMIALRKQHPQLAGEQIQWLEVGNPHLAAYLRGDILVVQNMSDQVQPLLFPVDVASVNWKVLLQSPGQQAPGMDAEWSLQPYAYCWLLQVDAAGG